MKAMIVKKFVLPGLATSTPSPLRYIFDGLLDVSYYLTMENMDTHAYPIQQVWVHDKEDVLVTVIREETLNTSKI